MSIEIKDKKTTKYYAKLDEILYLYQDVIHKYFPSNIDIIQYSPNEFYNILIKKYIETKYSNMNIWVMLCILYYYFPHYKEVHKEIYLKYFSRLNKVHNKFLTYINVNIKNNSKLYILYNIFSAYTNTSFTPSTEINIELSKKSSYCIYFLFYIKNALLSDSKNINKKKIKKLLHNNGFPSFDKINNTNKFITYEIACILDSANNTINKRILSLNNDDYINIIDDSFYTCSYVNLLTSCDDIINYYNNNCDNIYCLIQNNLNYELHDNKKEYLIQQIVTKSENTFSQFYNKNMFLTYLENVVKYKSINNEIIINDIIDLINYIKNDYEFKVINYYMIQLFEKHISRYINYITYSDGLMNVFNRFKQILLKKKINCIDNKLKIIDYIIVNKNYLGLRNSYSHSSISENIDYKNSFTAIIICYISLLEIFEKCEYIMNEE